MTRTNIFHVTVVRDCWGKGEGLEERREKKGDPRGDHFSLTMNHLNRDKYD